jgi:hypothetical protein
MNRDERREGQNGTETPEAPVAGAEPELMDDLKARMAELDAIAWNLPRATKEAGRKADSSDLEPAG